MAKNDPDGKRHDRTSFTALEADTFQDRAASIERQFQRRVRQGLLAIANANLSQQAKKRQARHKRGEQSAIAGASGLQGFGSRQRAATAQASNAAREADASHRLSVIATRQAMAQDRQERDELHAVNLRDLLAGRLG